MIKTLSNVSIIDLTERSCSKVYQDTRRMLRLLFGFWFLSNVRTKEQRRKEKVKQIIYALLTVGVLGWFKLNPPTEVIHAPKSNVHYAADSGHTIVYDPNKD